MTRLPFFFIVTGMIGFVSYHVASLFTLANWMTDQARGPEGWFYAHLFVLGWATMLAMGAVYQLINVILQGKLYSEKLGYVHYVVFTIGLAGLLVGFIQSNIHMIAIFASLAFVGIVLFVWNIATTLIRAKQWTTITISAACSMMYLLLTGISGMAMGLNFAFGAWNELHDRLYGTHIWLGTIGWFGLLITGFSYKMLPMFYLAHHYPERMQRYVLLAWNAAVIVGACSFLFDGGSWSLEIAIILLAIALILYTIHLLQIKKHRHKRSPGSGIAFSMYANQIFALIVVALALYGLWKPQHLLDTNIVIFATWCYLGGFVSFTILCYASKIVPFLWWTFKYGKHAGKPGTPVMNDLLNERKVKLLLSGVACASILMLFGLFLESSLWIAILGALVSITSIAYMALVGWVFKK
ncbi:MAG: hypothetical protein P0Y55_11725 [Candidatus Cohnella colombiensis]|uniref:Cbb3-type cytochrome c oxidase subunit I n=1 Tax=Candidatus Cohnella colombiensis TaxID=3121368 RepID=A0AA95J9F7_9BACL|nr:MAG: hypothetical protein P0Y55_11725 [Cohnella sp.]